ncbi:hypothetical protein ES703_01284 [subsurface metagenome]
MPEVIFFPEKEQQHYYDSHYLFLKNLLSSAGMTIKDYKEERKERGFIIIYKNKKILIDYGDHHPIANDWQDFDIQFRFHYSKKMHGHLSRVFPLTPISFYDWGQYINFQKEIRYACNTDKILNNQKPGAAAMERRTRIQEMLKYEYHANFDTEITDKETFWKKINKCLVLVCVPGARNDILDRGQFQYMAFGTCTISPPLDIELPYWRELKAGVHYLSCKPDYSNLIDIIEHCRNNRGACRAIGNWAKELFLATSTPKKVWGWINQCIKELK